MGIRSAVVVGLACLCAALSPSLPTCTAIHSAASAPADDSSNWPETEGMDGSSTDVVTAMSSLRSEGGAQSFTETPHASSFFQAQSEASATRPTSFSTNASNQPALRVAAKTTKTPNKQEKSEKNNPTNAGQPSQDI
eukprot:GHVT01060588.1.p3 GENE.GHVT01060588.1~~GHVT01060588.1.p3  ORF type:complete len:137 (-),score=25.49 GHVT01060588.1:838-1248(-)